MKIKHDELAVKFLLGKFSEQEQAKIEADYFKNNTLFEEIRIAENDLIDAYVTGNLSSEDHKRFENRLLLNPQQRQRVEFAKTLVRYASNNSLSVEKLNAVSVKSNWLTFISQLFSTKQTFSLAFAAAILVLLGAGIWVGLNNSLNNSFQVNQNDELAEVQTPELQTPAQQEKQESEPGIINSNETKEPKPKASPKIRESNPTNLSPTPQQKPLTPITFSLVLSTGQTRDAGTSQQFTIPSKADFVKMQLKFEEGNFESYSAVLETVEGQQVWSRNRLKAPEGSKNVNVLIPSKLLKKADYILTLKGINKDGTSEKVENYAFTINSR